MSDNIDHSPQIIKELSKLFNLTSEIGTEVKSLSKAQAKTDEKLDKIITEYHRLNTEIEIIKKNNTSGVLTEKINDLEDKAKEIEGKLNEYAVSFNSLSMTTASSTARLDKFLDYAWKAILIILVSVLLWKLGISPSESSHLETSNPPYIQG